MTVREFKSVGREFTAGASGIRLPDRELAALAGESSSGYSQSVRAAVESAFIDREFACGDREFAPGRKEFAPDDKEFSRVSTAGGRVRDITGTAGARAD